MSAGGSADGAAAGAVSSTMLLAVGIADLLLQVSVLFVLSYGEPMLFVE